MTDFEQMTEEQKNIYNNFQKKYSDSVIETFSNLYFKEYQEIITRDYYKFYLNIVKKTAILIQELGVNDPFQATVIFEYLLWNGYLSKDKKLLYSMSDRVNNIGAVGADIIRGKSVCLNNADMLSIILRNMGIESYLLGCYVDPKVGFEFEYKPDIKREKDIILKDRFKSKLLAPLAKRLGNHAVTIFGSKGNYFIGDPTNLVFFNFDGFLKAKGVGSDLQIDIMPFMSLVIGGIPSEDFHRIFSNTCSFNTSLLTLDNVKQLSEKSLDLCKKNISLLDDFYDDNKKDIDGVCSNLIKERRKR